MDKYDEIRKLWNGFEVKTESDIDLRLDNFRILFAYNSGKIENDNITYGDTREIFENGKVLNYSGDPRAIFETQNQKKCYEFLKPKIASREVLSLDLVKSTHEVLTSGTYDERRYIVLGERPGEFKKHDYMIGRAEAGSLPQDVERDLSELIEEIVEPSDNPLVAATYFHAVFENIHPFADGNGRVGRTLLNYYLMINDHPPIIIFDDDKERYYDALYSYDIEEDIVPLRDFLKAQTIKTWAHSLERNKG